MGGEEGTSHFCKQNANSESLVIYHSRLAAQLHNNNILTFISQKQSHRQTETTKENTECTKIECLQSYKVTITVYYLFTAGIIILLIMIIIIIIRVQCHKSHLAQCAQSCTMTLTVLPVTPLLICDCVYFPDISFCLTRAQAGTAQLDSQMWSPVEYKCVAVMLTRPALSSSRVGFNVSVTPNTL